jgi:hypothetical protein
MGKGARLPVPRNALSSLAHLHRIEFRELPTCAEAPVAKARFSIVGNSVRDPLAGR